MEVDPLHKNTYQLLLRMLNTAMSENELNACLIIFVQARTRIVDCVVGKQTCSTLSSGDPHLAWVPQMQRLQMQ